MYSKIKIYKCLDCIESQSQGEIAKNHGNNTKFKRIPNKRGTIHESKCSQKAEVLKRKCVIFIKINQTALYQRKTTNFTTLHALILFSIYFRRKSKISFISKYSIDTLKFRWYPFLLSNQVQTPLASVFPKLQFSLSLLLN